MAAASRLPLLRALLGLACCCALPSAFAACAPAAQNSVLKGAVAIDLGTQDASLVRVRQYADDFELRVDSTAPFSVNAPGDRNSADYLLLERAVHGAAPVLCLYSVFAQAAPGEFAVEQLALDGAGADLLAALRSLNSAGALWHSGSSANFAQSGAQYAALAEVPLPELPQFTFDMRLFATLAQVKLLQYAEAIPSLQALLAEFPGHPDLYKVHFQLGKVYLRQRRIPDAIMHLETAQDLIGAATAPERAWLRFERGEVESWLGEAYVHDGDLDAAAAVLDLAVADAAPDFALLGRIFDNKGLVGIRRGEVAGITREERVRWYDLSTEDHLSAAYFSRNAGDRETLQVTENNIAIHYARVGERRKSIVHFLNVLRMLDEVDNPEWRAFLLSNLSNYSRVLGDYSKAYAYLQQSLDLASPSGTTSYASNFCRMGTLLELLGDPEAGHAQHNQCLELAVQNGDAYAQMDARLLLSRTLLARNELTAVEAMLEPAPALLEKLNDPQLRQRMWIQRARVLLAAQRPADADTVIREGLALGAGARFPNETIEALELAMRVQLAMARPDEALAFGEEGMQLIESLHTQLEAERLGPAWNNQSSSLFELVASIELEQHRANGDRGALERALQTLERSRDISLRQRLAAGLPNDSASLEEQRQLALFSRISSLVAEAGREGPLPAMSNADYFHQHDLLSLARLGNLDAVSVPEPVALAQVQRQLSPDQLVLYYMATGAQLHVLALTAQDFTLVRTLARSEVDGLLAEADRALEGANLAAIALLRQLSTLLLPDFAAYPEVRDLLIVPHTGLHTLPFAALSAAAEGQAYTPLVARYSLSNLPSLSSYFMEKAEREVAHSTGIAVLADPVFSGPQLAALADPLPTAEAWRGWSDKLEALPYTAREAANVASQFPGRTLTFTGPAANRRNLSDAQTRNAKVLHIATHGYFASTSKDNVGLALSTVDDAGNADPGFITLTELFGYAFNNQLVVISGCETALGKEQAGVGLNGLTRGFLAQGVPQVISTLWPVSDRATAEFMRLFYHHLDASRNVARALQLAQQELGNNPDYRSPWYWAGFVLTTTTPDATLDLSL